MGNMLNLKLMYITSNGCVNGDTIMFAGHACCPMNSVMLYCGSGRPGGGWVTSARIGTTPPALVRTGGELNSGTPSVLVGWKLRYIFDEKCKYHYL